MDAANTKPVPGAEVDRAADRRRWFVAIGGSAVAVCVIAIASIAAVHSQHALPPTRTASPAQAGSTLRTEDGLTPKKSSGAVSAAAKSVSNVVVVSEDGLFMATAPLPATAHLGAGLGGPLAIDKNGCLQLGGSDDGVSTLWPFGYSLRRAGKQVQLLDADGTVVGVVGQDMRLGGGSIPAVDFDASDRRQRCLNGANLILVIGQVMPK